MAQTGTISPKTRGNNQQETDPNEKSRLLPDKVVSWKGYLAIGCCCFWFLVEFARVIFYSWQLVDCAIKENHPHFHCNSNNTVHFDVVMLVLTVFDALARAFFTGYVCCFHGRPSSVCSGLINLCLQDDNFLWLSLLWVLYLVRYILILAFDQPMSGTHIFLQTLYVVLNLLIMILVVVVVVREFKEEQLKGKYASSLYMSAMFFLFGQYFVFTFIAYFQLAYHITDIQNHLIQAKCQEFTLQLLRFYVLAYYNQTICGHLFRAFQACCRRRRRTRIRARARAQEHQV